MHEHMAWAAWLHHMEQPYHPPGLYYARRLLHDPSVASDARWIKPVGRRSTLSDMAFRSECKLRSHVDVLHAIQGAAETAPCRRSGWQFLYIKMMSEAFRLALTAMKRSMSLPEMERTLSN